MAKKTPIASALLALALCAGCGGPEPIPSIESPAPPPPSTPAPPVPQYVQGDPALSQAPAPRARMGVSVFSVAANGEITYSAEWTSELVRRLEQARAPAVAIEQAGHFDSDIDKGTQELVGAPSAKAVDILIAGTVRPGNPAQVHLLARETREARIVLRSDFEGDVQAALQRAADDVISHTTR